MEDMSFESFKFNIQQDIKDFLPEKYENSNIRIQQVEKNNEKLDALIISSSDSNITPSIYLQPFYAKMEAGESYESQLQQIADIRVSHEVPLGMDVSDITDYDKAKDKIVPKLFSEENNQNFLANKPYTEVDGLAVVYSVMVASDSEGTASVTVTNQLMESWGVTKDELHTTAISNLSENQDITFRSMSEVMSDMMVKDIMSHEDVDRETAQQMVESMLPPDDIMYVLSNTSNLNGAAALLDEKTMSDISEKLGEVYILPSSVHEVIVVPKDSMDLKSLEAMVQEVNASQVAPQDRLSDHVYTYDNETKELYRADHEQEHQLAKQEAKENRNAEQVKDSKTADRTEKSSRASRDEKSDRPSLKERLNEKKTEVKLADKTPKEQVKAKDKSL